MKPNPLKILSDYDTNVALAILGGLPREPDLTIAPDGQPYIYRWHVIPRNVDANVYLHIQVASDPERPLHDHPWANTSVVLSGGYIELLAEHPKTGQFRRLERKAGDVIYREAHWAHRIVLPSYRKYCLTLFTTGPKVRDWGFWTENRGWVDQRELIENLPDGRSIFKENM